MHRRKLTRLFYVERIIIVGLGKSVVVLAVNHLTRLRTSVKLLESWTVTISITSLLGSNTCASLPLGKSRFKGLSSIGTSINFVRTRSRAESVIPRFLRSCISALILRSVAVVAAGGSTGFRSVVIVAIMNSLPSFFLAQVLFFPGDVVVFNCSLICLGAFPYQLFTFPTQKSQSFNFD
jgi:hypothetical protein